MHANAKHTFALSLLILAVTAAGSAWLYTSTANAGDTAVLSYDDKPPALNVPTSLPLIAFADHHLNNEFIIPINPFAPSLTGKNIEEVLARTRGVETRGNTWSRPLVADTKPGTATAANNNTGNRPTAPGNVTATPKPGATPPAAPPVNLSYKGYMTRADGVALALVKKDAETARFLAAHQTIAGAEILTVSLEAITLRHPNGEEQTLPLHETTTLK